MKDRYTGRAGGNTMCLHFDHQTAQLTETEFPEGLHDSNGDKPSHGFQPVDMAGLDL